MYEDHGRGKERERDWERETVIRNGKRTKKINHTIKYAHSV